MRMLGMWSGMGYYRRAKGLHAAARMVVAEFDGRVPSDVNSLLGLPGVGRYTAGAIASIAFGEPEPLVDGNVARVLLRVHGKKAAAEDRDTQAWLWQRAAELVNAAKEPGVFNEGVMELGATVCTPAPSSPRCGECPLASMCVARRKVTQGDIPTPKAAAKQQTIYCTSVVVTRRDGATLIEQRPHTGMWAGMWQAPTIQRKDRAATRAEIARLVGTPAAAISQDSTFEHQTTHRRVLFSVWRGRGVHGKSTRGEWVMPEKIATLGISNPQRRILLGAATTRG
jgi:A/G-specific adenine glycosylase